MGMNQTEDVRRWLQARWHILVPEDWLEACLEWIHSENQGMPISQQDLKAMVHEQWLLSDLREIGASCLPSTLAQQQKHQLRGNYCLQMDSILDVSTSFYSQLQKVQGTENANVNVTATQPSQPSWEPKASRMLMMKLTDGSQDVQGMEYQTIPSLNTHLTPGTKILVSGEILCRMGVLMLKAENVTVLGGEVESMMETNTQESLLQAMLGQNTQLSENPPREQRMQFDTSVPSGNAVNRRSNNAPHNSSSHPTNQASVNSIEDDFLEDDLLDTMDTAQLEAMEEQWEDDVDYGALMEQMDFPDHTTSGRSTPCFQQPPAKKPYISSTGFNAIHNQNTSASSSHNSDLPNSFQSRMEGKAAENIGYNKPSMSGTFTSPDVVNERKCNSGSITSTQNSTKRTSRNTALQKRLDSFWSKPVKSEPQPSSSSANLYNSSPRSDTQTKTEINVSLPDTKSVFGDDDDDIAFVDLTEVVDSESQSLLGGPANSARISGGGTITTDSSISEPGAGRTSLTETGHVQKDFDALSIMSSVDLIDHFLQGKFPKAKKKTALGVAPYTYLSEVLKISPTKTQVFLVKAYISTLVSKLENNNGTHWSLTVKINDGTAALDVDLGDEMLTALIGFTAAECMKMRAMAKQDKDLRRKIGQGIKQCQQYLISLSEILELEISPQLTRPYVRSHYHSQKSHLDALKERVINS